MSEYYDIAKALSMKEVTINISDRNLARQLAKFIVEKEIAALKSFATFLVNDIGLLPCEDRLDFYLCENDIFESLDRFFESEGYQL